MNEVNRTRDENNKMYPNTTLNLLLLAFFLLFIQSFVFNKNTNMRLDNQFLFAKVLIFILNAANNNVINGLIQLNIAYIKYSPTLTPKTDE